MPDIFQLIAAWKKQILLTVLFSMIVATTIVFILPPKYLASVTAVPSNPATADKSRVFNNNIRELYSSLGDATDLDMIVGTGQLDTIYIAVAKKFRLNAYYDVKDTSGTGVLKAARILKKDTKIAKTEFGELQVRVWCSDRFLAPRLANALTEELAGIHKALLDRNNIAILRSLEADQTDLSKKIAFFQQGAPSANKESSQQGRANALIEQLAVYEKLILEYNLILRSGSPAIHIVEYARVSDKPDAPNKMLIILATAVASFLFGLWLAVLLEKRKRTAG